MSDQLTEIFNWSLRSDFTAFLHCAMQTLHPGAAYHHNWHIEAIAHQLDRVRRGEITRLIINLPPRSLKSVMVSVAFPALLLGHDPTSKIFGISYGADLAAKHANDFRAVVQSPWYRRAFPGMRIERVADDTVWTTQRGYRAATSIHGPMTGLGGDYMIIDDPLKPEEAYSDKVRTGVNSWFSSTLLSRLDDKRTGVIIVVMQRVHNNDLTGYLLEQAGWEILSLPAIAEVDERIPLANGEFHHRRAGEALHPEREPIEVLETLRQQLGPDLFAAQYQQSPVPPGGNMIRREWLQYYDKLPERTFRTKVIQSWDTANKNGAQNDWSVCTTWLQHQDCYYLMDVTRGRYEFPQLRDTALALAKRFDPSWILIEDASTGAALASAMKEKRPLPIKLVPVEHDKRGRLYFQQAKFAAGQVRLPRKAPFLAELEAELLAFPDAKHDDQVDSLTQALSYKGSSYDSTMSWV